MRVPRLVTAERRSCGMPRRAWSAAVLGITGVLVGALVGAGPAAAAGVGSLTLSPDRGRPTAQFAISYSYPQQNGTCAQVLFCESWMAMPRKTPGDRGEPHPALAATASRTASCFGFFARSLRLKR